MLPGLFINGCRVFPLVVGFRFSGNLGKPAVEHEEDIPVKILEYHWKPVKPAASHCPDWRHTHVKDREIWVLGAELDSKYKGVMETSVFE